VYIVRGEPCDWLDPVRFLRQLCARGRHYSFVSTEQDPAGLLEGLEVVVAVIDNVVDIGEDDVLVTSWILLIPLIGPCLKKYSFRW
jgi:hypothetical protein